MIIDDRSGYVLEALDGVQGEGDYAYGDDLSEWLIRAGQPLPTAEEAAAFAASSLANVGYGTGETSYWAMTNAGREALAAWQSRRDEKILLFAAPGALSRPSALARASSSRE